ncbi:hypothetical protein D3C85_1076950 [compost metagenome]
MAARPRRAAPSRTLPTRSRSKGVGGKYCTCLTSTVTPCRSATSAQAASQRSSMPASVASSSCRRSTVKRTWPGMTLRDPGWAWISPTVPRPWGWLSLAMPTTVWSRKLAAYSASRRIGIGVGPACISMPVTTTSYHRTPSEPVTTPTTFSSCSRMGPCSIWASKYAPTGRPPTGSAPA